MTRSGPGAGDAYLVRPARPDEVAAIADLVNRAEPWRGLPMTAGDIELAAQGILPGGADVRLVATPDGPGGPLVAHGWLRDEGWPLDAFYLQLRVDPDHRRRGLGTRLLDALLAEAGAGRREVATFTSELAVASIAFAAAVGFREHYRLVGWRIDPATFDPGRHPARPLPDGVRITTAAEIDGPAFRRAMHELAREVDEDVPSPDPIPQFSFEQWERETFGSPRYRADTHLVAVDGERPVGECWIEVDGETAWNHFTAVARSHRGRGIAIQLKLASLALTRRLGVRELLTENHTGNAGMLAINERLGFERRPGFIRFGLDLPRAGGARLPER